MPKTDWPNEWTTTDQLICAVTSTRPIDIRKLTQPPRTSAAGTKMRIIIGLTLNSRGFTSGPARMINQTRFGLAKRLKLRPAQSGL